MEKTKFNLKLLVWCLIVFILALLIRVHFISYKQGFHVDEMLSINIANINEYGWVKPIPKNKAYTGKQLKQMVLFDNPTLKDTLDDIKKLHKNNNDPPHTNLYYTALRAWFNGFDSIDIRTIIWKGLSLNLVFFSLSFLLMYKILRKLFDDNALIPFGLLIAFLNTGSISNTLFLRPYQLQETIFLLLTYVTINFYQDIKSNKFLTAKNFIIAACVLALTLLSGYMSIFFIAFLGIGLIYASIKEKQQKNILFLIIAAILSVGLAWLGYLGYFNGFSSGRSEEALSLFKTSEIISNLKQVFYSYSTCLLYFIYYIPAIILMLIAYLHRYIRKIDQKTTTTTKYIFGSAILWTLIVMYLVPFKVVRYITPVFPLLAILYPMLINGFKKIEKYIYIWLFSIIFVICAMIPQSFESIDTRYARTNAFWTIGARIENLYLATLPLQVAVKTTNIPVVIDYGFFMLHLIPLLSDNNVYYFVDSSEFRTTADELYLMLPENKKMNDELNIVETINAGWGMRLMRINNK